ncbi:hypothetical protein K1719_030786 [Acacia pycnantha]|nr:hypothetical protein K1719_030786 [Acacia pycnantha]
MMSQIKEFKLFGATIVLPAENQISEEAMDQQRRTTNNERKGNEIQENKDHHHDQIQVERSTTYQISEFKLFGVIMALPVKDQISEEVVDQERSTSNNNRRRDEIQENKDHDQETLLSTEINQISREAAKEEEEPSVKRRRTNKQRKINDKNNSSSKESSSDRVSLMLPEMTKKKIDEVGGRNIIKIIEKKVYESDLCKTNDRLSIPEKKILLKAEDFLKPEELDLLMTKDAKTKKFEGIPVLVLDPNLKEFNLVLKRWKMTNSITYNLTHRWYDVVKCNNFQVGDVVQLWSFRRLGDQLGFAVVKL